MRITPTQLRFVLRVLVIGACVLVARGEKLPFRIYTTADGLAQDSVNKIVRDSRGFLWFCTGDGLSRFNGYSFKTYTQEQGLPSRSVTDLLETKNGEYLIASTGGLVAFDPLGKAYRWSLIEGKLEQNGSDPPMFRTFTFPDDPNIKGGNSILSLTPRLATIQSPCFASTNRPPNSMGWLRRNAESTGRNSPPPPVRMKR